MTGAIALDRTLPAGRGLWQRWLARDLVIKVTSVHNRSGFQDGAWCGDA